MREGEASRTARYMALFRAVESARPAARRLTDDGPVRRLFAEPLISLLACRPFSRSSAGARRAGARS